jgi:ribonuclease Z
MKRWQVVLGLVALSALVIYVLRGPLALQLMGVALPRMMAADPIGDLPDGLHLTLCGAGSPLPDPKRSGPCVGIVAGGKLFVVDAGSGAARNLNAFGLPAGQVEAVFLTHFHSDHIDGLGELALQRWAGGVAATEPLPLFGPDGVQNIAEGFNQAYQADTRYRVAHHGESVMVPSASGLSARRFATPEPGRPTVVWDRDGVKVTSFRVNHAPIDPAVGYRFDYAGRSVVISGDTIRSPEIERMSEGVDLLVHEALAPQLVGMMAQAASDAGLTKRAKIVNDILDYHASPVDAAESAEVAGVGHLLFYHVVPPLLLPGMDAVFLDGVDDAFAGEFTLGQDGTRVSLPAGSTAIEVSGG